MSEYAAKVAQDVIDQLERGVAPWTKPWSPGERFMPWNPVTEKPYRGMNAMYLLMQGRSDSRWLTRRQAEAAGAELKAGERGNDIRLQFFAFHKTQTRKDERGRIVRDGDGKPIKDVVQLERPQVTNFWVYNADQFVGLPEQSRQVAPESERHAKAEALIAASKADIRHVAGDRAYYYPAQDHIVLPPFQQFDKADGYYATALHELGHWTGHESRLGRDLSFPRGSEGYAREELRAEIASLMVGDELGIGHDPTRHAAYVGSWVKILKDDPREIFRAATDAEKIAKFLQNPLAQTHVESQAAERQTAPVLEPVAVAAAAAANLSVGQPKAQQLDLQGGNMRRQPQRVVLNIPYAEKNRAKNVAKANNIPLNWDKEAKLWWAPGNADLAPMDQWRHRSTVDQHLSPEEEFKAVLEKAGFDFQGPAEMTGKIQRVPMKDDVKGARSGAYCGYKEGHQPGGWFQDHRSGERVNWKSDRPVERVSEAERQQQEREAQQAKDARDREIAATQRKTAGAIAELLQRCEPASRDHAYLVKKGVGGLGLLVNKDGPINCPPGADDPQHFSARGHLLVPYHDIDGNLLGAQTISPRDSNNKSMPKGAALQGGHHIIGKLKDDDPILIVEGWATGKTIFDETGRPVIVAFNANNLVTVAKAYREKYPNRAIVTLGDNDHRKEGQLNERTNRPYGNPGREKANEAAQAVGGQAVIPSFTAGQNGTDWNDLRQDQGKDAFHEQFGPALAGALAIIERRSLAAAIAEERQSQQLNDHRRQEPRQREFPPKELERHREEVRYQGR